MKHKVYWIMGVSGSGKSTIGKMLAKKLKSTYFEGDDYHSANNIAKMKLTQALTDEDRLDWLLSLNNLARKELQQNSLVISCSALKEQYRQILEKDIQNQCEWIFLKGDYETIAGRMKKRKGHFMHMDLLQSQFDTLEVPEYGFQVSIKQPVEKIIQEIIEKHSE